CGWPAFNRTDYGNSIFINIKTHAYSHKSATHIISRMFIFTFWYVNGMWIEVFKNTIYGNVNNTVCVNVIYVFIIYIVNESIKFIFFRFCSKDFFGFIIKVHFGSNENTYSKRQSDPLRQIYFLISHYSESKSEMCCMLTPAFSRKAIPELSLYS